MNFYQYIGNMDTLFDKRGRATEDNPLNMDEEELVQLEVEKITKASFEKRVALPYKLGFITDIDRIVYLYEPTNDLLMAQDAIDDMTYIFKKGEIK